MATHPSFTHDCDACTFLGSHLDHDLYVCFHEDSKRFTYIARYGSECDAYSSLPAGIVKTLEHDDILYKALEAHVAMLSRVLSEQSGFIIDPAHIDVK